LANLYDYNDWKAYWNLKEVEREHLYAIAKTARTIVDVGTNNGWVLMNMAAITKLNNGFVYGFEPHPVTYKRCIKNIEVSDITNCKVFNMGCGETETEFSMTVVKDSNSGQNRIINGSDTEEKENAVMIKVARLDKQLAEVSNIDLIKIDVEGFEMHVLKGAYSILKKHKPVLFVEIDEQLLRSNNTSPELIIDYLKTNFNYKILNAANEETIDDNFHFLNCHIDIICLPA